MRLKNLIASAHASLLSDGWRRPDADDLLADAGAEPVVAFQSAEIDTMRGLVRAGLGLSILPRPPRPDEDDPVYLPFVPRTTRRLGLAWCATTTHTPAVDRFLSTVPDRLASPSA